MQDTHWESDKEVEKIKKGMRELKEDIKYVDSKLSDDAVAVMNTIKEWVVDMQQ